MAIGAGHACAEQPPRRVRNRGPAPPPRRRRSRSGEASRACGIQKVRQAAIEVAEQSLNGPSGLARLLIVKLARQRSRKPAIRLRYASDDSAFWDPPPVMEQPEAVRPVLPKV